MQTLDLGKVVGQQGPQGETGPQGPQGETGPAPTVQSMLETAKIAIREAEQELTDTLTITADYTLAALAGRTYHVTSVGEDTHTLTLTLPESGVNGDRIVVCVRSGDATQEMIDQSTSAAETVAVAVQERDNVALVGGASPAAAWGHVIDCRFCSGVWLVDFASMQTPDGWSRDNVFNGTIIYSGAGWAATAGTTFEQTVRGGQSVALRTDIFRSLYGCPLVGWSVTPNATQNDYEDGATVTVAANQTLTLYPRYDTDAQEFTTGLPGQWGGPGTMTGSLSVAVGDVIGGYAERNVLVHLVETAGSGNGDGFHVYYRLQEDDPWTQLAYSATAGHIETGEADLVVPVSNGVARVYVYGTGGQNGNNTARITYIKATNQ